MPSTKSMPQGSFHTRYAQHFPSKVSTEDTVQRTPRGFDITLQDASVDFGKGPIFEGVNLVLPARKTTCLLGPSGVGKSTLLKFLAGLVNDQTTGKILCSDGQNLVGRVAYMAQQDLLLPWKNIRENVVLGARLRGERPDYTQADRLIQSVGLEEAAKLLPAALSGGMKQRAALARTLMEDKPVVLMDEPFSALDPINRLKLQDLAAQVLKDKTVLLVTHDPLEALRLADHVYILHGAIPTLRHITTPPGIAPRDVTDPDILSLQALLLSELATDNDPVKSPDTAKFPDIEEGEY